MIRERRTAYAFIAPAVLVLGGIILYPILDTVVMAFFRVDRQGIKQAFVGFSNFQRLLADPVFWQVLKQTTVWTVSMVLITTVISLAAAILLNREFTGCRFFRVAILLPWAVSAAILSLIWRYLYSFEFGLLNHTLKTLRVINELIPWLALPQTAFPAVIWVGVQNSVPFTTLGLLGGLQSIPTDVYEAGEIDGAVGWAKFRYITLPMLKYVLTVVTLINVIFIFRSFPIVWVLTTGGPINYTDIVGTYLYKIAFRALDMGLASALAVIGFVILIVFVLTYSKVALREGL